MRVIIPSARPENLIRCVQSILSADPMLAPSDIIVIDDGARADSESSLPAVTWVAGVKPFVFARNINLGIQAAGASDVILMNDDARLLTQNGFSEWRLEPAIGICSAHLQGSTPPRGEPTQLAFVCVYIPRAVIERVGLLDERFVGYGFEDYDYCRRAVAAGFRLAIWDGCIVDHSDARSSSFRTHPRWPQLIAQNRALYEEKWGTLA